MATNLPKTPAQLHRMLGIRLTIAAIAAGSIAGGAAYLAGTYRAEGAAREQAQDAIKHFARTAEQVLAPGGSNTHEHLKRLMGSKHFVAIRLFDASGQLAYETWEDPPEAGLASAMETHRHVWPEPGRNHVNWLRMGGERVIQVVLPLDGPKTSGYLEGIYRIDLQTWQQLRRQILDVIAAAVASVIFATVLMHPLLLAMLGRLNGLSRRLLDANLSLIRSLGNAVAKRDSDTDAHNYRVTLYAVALAEAMKVPSQEIADLVAGAFLHDVGKIGIPDKILLKPGKLDDAEFAVMKEHSKLGLDIVGDNAWMAGAAAVIRHHHERYDGQGYPDGLAGYSIPLNARIFAVVDVFDALTSARPYKPPFPVDEALLTIMQGAGKHFDTQIAATFVSIATPLHARLAQASDQELHRELREVLACYFKS